MDKKTDILEAARRLFGQFGLKKVTVEDIAREASLSKVTLYKIFHHKHEIFDDVVRIEADQMLGLLNQAVEREPTAAGKLKAHLKTKMEKTRELINFYHVTHETMNLYWPHLADVAERFVAGETEVVKGIIEHGNQTGEFAIQSVGPTAHVMVISLRSLEYYWGMARSAGELESFVDLLVEIILNGLRRR